jgi:hypothetical protein
MRLVSEIPQFPWTRYLISEVSEFFVTHWHEPVALMPELCDLSEPFIHFCNALTERVLGVMERICSAANDDHCNIIVPAIAYVFRVCIDCSADDRYSGLVIKLSSMVLSLMRANPCIVPELLPLIDYLFVYLSKGQSMECIHAILDFLYMSPRYIPHPHQFFLFASAMQHYSGNDTPLYEKILSLLSTIARY